VLAGSFALFFGMILADAGYAMMLAAAVGLVWRPLGRSPALQRFRLLLLVLAAVSAAFGMVTGSYFGIAPPAGTALSRLRLIDTSNMLAMMELAIGVGVLHIVLANFIVARQERGLRRIAPIGWILGLLGGPALYLGEMHAVGGLLWAGYAFIAAGLVAIAGYSGVGRPPLGRAIDGLLALVKVPAAFGDVLSYFRLFALGYAGTSLAVAFNRLAADVAGQVPGFGLLLAGFILVLGHGLNFVLGVAGGFVHGLRLNFIEFFNWSLSAEGRPFRAFKKSEVVPSLR
jgi:V/A-type H+-transporting ATPase subunit I